MSVAVLLAHVAATLVMVGVIWFVQVVHYPLFAQVGADGFVEYAAAHSRLTTYVVALPMAVEGVTGLALLVTRPAGIPLWLVLVGLVALAVALGSTQFVQVPQHRLLGDGFEPVAWRTLVTTNWIRTAAWSARGAVVLAMVAAALRG